MRTQNKQCSWLAWSIYSTAIKLFTQPPNEGAIINILVLNLLIINVTEHYIIFSFTVSFYYGDNYSIVTTLQMLHHVVSYNLTV